MLRGADILVQALAQAGITRIFSLSGNQIMVVYDACLEHGIEIVHTRHEGATVYMAEAWAQVTGQPGVALVTAGPGLANSVGALFSARSSETPLLLLSGDSPQAADGTAPFQALDQVSITSPVTRLSLRLQSTEKIARDVGHALAQADGARPGPVHIAMPVDLLDKKIGAIEVLAPAVLDNPDSALDISELAPHLAAARNPLIVTGPANSRSRAESRLQKLEQASGLPVISMESPRGLKDPTLGALSTVLPQADLIISLGKRVDFSLAQGKPGTFSADAGWIVVDADSDARDLAASNLNDRLIACIDADPAVAMSALADSDLQGEDGWAQQLRSAMSQLPQVSSSSTPNSGSVCQALQHHIEKQSDSLIVCDGGEFGQWAQALTCGNRRLTNGPSGAIGASICYATAASLASPDTTVFALLGDGTAGFYLAEFETAARAGAAFVALIGNDSRWNAEHQIQLNSYGEDRLIGCELGNARYDQVAIGLGGHGEYVTDMAELDAAIERAIQSGKPACINVMIEGLPAPAGVPSH